MSVELAVVMPVYNEEACIKDVVEAWLAMLLDQQIDFRMIILNDGSKDQTRAQLEGFEENPHVEVIHKPNSGHGPTILQGYHHAVTQADWVFQCDSDDEMEAGHFPKLWHKRSEYDALFGIRFNREQNVSRKILTMWSRMTIRLWFGAGVTDVNTPYRLIRSVLLENIVSQIPEDTFAPNLIISGALSRAKKRIFECNIPHEGRRTGQVSIMKWKLWNMAFRAFWQTIQCRPVLSEVKQVSKNDANRRS